jgi:sigma-B regulation protein RsbU (phosphoserine phosphatase)
MLLARPSGGRGTLEMLEATGPLLGPFNGTWETLDATMKSSDLLVACTDGLTEARDAAQEEWGIDGLAAVVRQNAGNGPDAVADAALAASRRHGSGSSSPDDVTLLVLGRS